MVGNFDRGDDEKRPDVERDLQDDRGHRSVNELKGKTILSVNEGAKIGSVDDVLIDPNSLRIAALTVTSGGVFDRETNYVPASDVNKWGKDAVLVEGREVFRAEADISDRETWISAGNKLNGLTMVDSQGTRLGRIEDVMIDESGKIVSYRISDSMMGGRSRDIPAGTTKAMGEDVVIVESEGRI
jgi:uncharacterized protein YrrD